MDFEVLVEAARSAMERFPVPGCALGLVANDEEHVAGLGVTSIDNPLDVDGDTLFQIGSITKTFTGTLAMRLVEQGRLELDEPVRTYLPDLRLAEEDVAARATMRHLLTHTGGWVGDYFDDPGRGEDALARFVAQLAELPQLTPLGEIFSYNNAGFAIAGRVLEVTGGRPFEELVAEHVLEPLGMKRTLFFAEDVLTHRFAAGHQATEDGIDVARPWSIGRAAHPAGGLNSSVRDLLRYARFHLGDEPAWLAEMRQPLADIRPGEQIGLTWMLSEISGVPLFGHGGGTNGQITDLVIAPERGVVLVVLTNSNRGSELVAEVERAAVGESGLEEPEWTPLDVTAAQLAEYAGRYVGPLTDIQLLAENGRMVARFTTKGGFPRRDSPPLPAPPPLYGPDVAFVPEGPFGGERAEFLRDDDGELLWLRVGVRLYKRES